MTRIKDMKDLPRRCSHPREDLVFRVGLIFGDYIECLRCGEALSREWVRARDAREFKHEVAEGQMTLCGHR
jgi:hypothetical protein